jgi:hypothetical protein
MTMISWDEGKMTATKIDSRSQLNSGQRGGETLPVCLCRFQMTFQQAAVASMAEAESETQTRWYTEDQAFAAVPSQTPLPPSFFSELDYIRA